MKEKELSSKHFITIFDIANRYSISTSTIWRWIKLGKFPKGKKIGGTARWRLSDLEKFEENLKDI